MTKEGALAYSVVAERLAVNLFRCMDELLGSDPDAIEITPDWIRGVHCRLAGELFPEWGGRFRIGEVQVGTHLPPPGYAVPEQIRNLCLDLEERALHLTDANSIAELLAWADWRFQWIHPFKDFNGRVGRILLVAPTYKLGLPPIDPAAAEEEKDAYFGALRSADAGDLSPLKELWLRRLASVP